MNSGVYLIRNTLDGKVYVGSSKDLSTRFRSHMYALNSDGHHSVKLQRAWNKYGTDAFVFEKVVVCSVENLLRYEQIVIDFYKAHTEGYNILCKAGSREGTPHSKEVAAKMKAFQRSYRKKYHWNGESLCIAEIAEIVGLPRDTLWRRVCSDGMSLQDAVAMPYKKPGQAMDGFGKSLDFYEWVDHIGCSEGFLRLWLSKGLSIEDCVEKHKKITVGEFARVSGVDSNMFSARIRADWSVGDALTLPKVALGGHHLKKRVYA